ncbi:zinc knuckle [Colletotrichum asianum]
MTEQWDIIAIQDPPPQLAFAHNLFKNHHICCRGTSPGELDAFNNPWAIAAHEKSARLKRDKGISNKLKLVPLYKVAFVVSKSIPLADWAVDWYPGEKNERLLATLYLETQLPTRMALHNVYNAYYEGRTTLDVEAFISTITQTGLCLIVGDLNFPHPWYGGPHVIPKVDAVKFVNELQAAHMECLLDPTKIPFTYTPGQVIDERASTLDVGFASPAFSPHVQDYKCLDVTGFKSDHRILETTIDTTPNLREDVCYQWNNVPRKVLRQEVGPALKALASLPLETRLDIDNYVTRVVEIIICAREKLAFKRKPPQITTKPKRKPAQSNPRPQETQPSSSTDTQETQPSSSTDNDPKAGRTYENYLKDKGKEAYRRYMDIQCQNIHKASKVSAQRSMPRSFGHIPVLEERLPDNSIRKYIEFDDKAEFMVRTLFPICTCGTVPPSVFDIPYLPGNLDETERARRQINPDEIACIVQNMPAHKAEGKDGVSIDVLKMLLPLEKNPERALEFLVEAVYRNWFAKKEKIFVTICALDITGAYDRVRRQHLLNILVRYGVPGWMELLITTFVDDITLLVASPSIKQNNEALAILYELLTEFAALNGTEFGPHKTKVMHMLQRGPAITDMPKVDGFPTKAVESMEILGVTLDYHLNWVEHVNNVLSKVRRKMFLLRRISATTWGASISELRTRYITAVRPIVAYACASVVDLLETQQNNSLRQISGAFPRASGHALCKELYIERMSVFLHRCARAYRASNKGTPEGMALCNLWERDHDHIRVTREVLQSHPYCVAYHEANTLLRVNAQIQLAVEIQTWTVPPDSVRGTAKRAARLKEIIKSLAKDLAEQTMKESWIDESNKRRCSLGKLAYDAPTWKGTYGKHNLEAYKPLRKAQGTILLGIKTGINGLNKPLFDMHRKETFMCPCGEHAHTAEHLFIHCKLLDRPREHLCRAVGGRLHFQALVECYPELAANFAIRYFGLEQFKWTAKHMPNPQFPDLRADTRLALRDGRRPSPGATT